MGEADGIPKVEQNHTLPRTVALITSHDPGHSLLRQRKDSINLLIKATSCSSSLLTLLSKLDKTSDSRRSVSLQDGVNSYFTNLYSNFFHLKFCVVSSAIKMCSFCWRRIREMIFFPGSEIPVPSLHGFETIPWGRAHRHHYCKGRSECRELQKRARCFVQHVQRLVVKKFLLFFLLLVLIAQRLPIRKVFIFQWKIQCGHQRVPKTVWLFSIRRCFRLSFCSGQNKVAVKSRWP